MKKVLLGLLGVACLAPSAGAAVIELAITPDGSANLVGAFPTNAKLLYNNTTGDIKIDPFGFNVSGFNLQDNLADATNVFAGSAAPTFPTGGLSTTDSDTKVAWATTSSFITTTVDLGNIAVTGLTAADLILQLNNVAAPLTTNDTFYTAQGIIGRQSLDIVPEPATLGLAAIAGLGLFARRSRRTI